MKLWPTIQAVEKNGRYYLKEKNMKKTKKYRYRSSITGYFVTEKYARKHPKTTEKELIK